MNSKIQENMQQSGLKQSGIANKPTLSRKQTNLSSLNGKNGKVGGTSTSKGIDVSKIEDKKFRDEEQKKRNLKKNKPFAIKNFEIIIDLLKFRKSSIEKAYIQVAFAFVCIFISNIRNYRDLVDMHYTVNEGNLSTVISVLSYIEFTTILRLNITLYQVIFFLSGAFAILTPVLYIVCYFVHSSDQTIKVRKFFYGRWFVYAGENFMWILLQPIYLTFMSYVACFEPVQKSLSLVCDSSDSLYSIRISIAVIGMVFGFFTIIFLSIYFFNGGFSTKKDALACDNTVHMLTFHLYRTLFSILICLRQSGYYYFAIYLIFNLIYTGYLSYQFFLNQGLLTIRNKYIRNLFKFLIIIQFSQNIAFSVDEFQRNLNIIGSQISENSGQYTAIFSIIVFYIFRKFSSSQELNLITGNDMKNISYTEFKKRTYYLQHLLETASESAFQDVYFKGIISQHINTPCFHSDSQQKCFCQMKFLHDSKKNKDVNIDRCYFSINRNIFCKFIIKSWFQQYIALNPNNFTAIIDYSEFIFNKMRNSILSLQNAIFLKKKYIYPFDQFRLFRLIHYIHKVNRKKNFTSYKSSLNIENVIPIEQKIDRIKYKIKQILNQNITFWNMLLKNIINREELNSAIQRVFEEIDEIKRMWIRVVVYLNYRKKWRFYYAWYYLYILNQKVLISLLEKFTGSLINENEIFVEEYQTDQVEDDVGSVMSNTKDDQDKINIKKIEMAFDRRSCVFRVASDNLGKIIKVNKPVLTTFGFNRYELENHIYVTDLMPKSFAIQHPKYTAHYISTGKSKVLYSQKKIFCVMKKGNVFAAWKFLKLYVNLQGETEFVSLIRPILNPAGSKVNYIIFNDDWEIDAMTQQMYEYFMIDSELYRQQMIQLANMKHKRDKNNENGQVIKAENKIAISNLLTNGMVLNLLLIIPKLIKFTKLFQFLTADDQEHFGIIPRKDKLGDIATFFKSKKKESSGGPQVSMQKLKMMAQKKKSLAQQTIAAKKAAQDEETKQNNGDESTKNQKTIQQHQQKLTITHANSDDFEKQKYKNVLSQEDQIDLKSPHYNNTPQKGSNQSAQNQLNMTLNQDDSIGQLLAIKQKNKEKYDEATAPSPKQIDNIKRQFQQQTSTVSMSSRQSSILDIQEQIHGDDKQNELIRKQIERVPFAHRRKTLHEIENQEEEEDGEKTNKGEDDSSQEDDDLESDFVPDNYDADGKKLIDERLEKGEQLRFVARVPYNINQLMLSYYTMSQSRLKRFEQQDKTKNNNEQQSQAQSKNEISNKIKTYTHNSQLTFKESNTNLSFKKEGQQERLQQKEEQEHQFQRDKAFYQLIKDAYTLHVKRKKTRQFKLICTTKFKKVGVRRVGIMKIHNLEEIKYHKMLMLQQVQKNNKEYEKSNLSLSKQLSGLKEPSSDSNAVNSNLKAVVSNLEVPTSQPQKYMLNKNAFLANLRNTLAPLNSNVSGGNNSFQDFSAENQDSKVQGNEFETKENGMGYQLDNFEENKKDEAMKDIQKDFEKKQGSVTFSLNSVDNIFIKEDIHQPKQQLNSIFQLQLFTRLVFLFILLFNIFTYFLGVNTYFTTIKSQSERVSLIKELNLKILNGYDNLLDQIMLNNGGYTDTMLSKTIYQSKTGMQKDIGQTFYDVTFYFQNIMIDSNFQETLFDTSASQQDSATALIINSTPSKGNYSFDAFDMFQEYIYHINELNNTMISSSQSSAISTSSINVDFIRKNVLPYLNNHIYELGQSAIDIVQNTMSSITKFILIITIILSVLVGFSFLFMWKFTKSICDSFTSIFDSFVNIDLVDVKKIANYYQIILQQFSYAVDKDEFYSRAYMPITNQLLLESDLKENEDDILSIKKDDQILQQGSNLQNVQTPNIKSEHTRATMDATRLSHQNPKVAAALLKVSDLQLEASDETAQVKKNKVIEDGNFLKDLKVKIILFYLIFMFCVICFSCVYILQVYLNQQTLEMMREDGLVFINPITLNYIMIISVKENTIDPLFYQSYLYQYAQPYVDLFFNIKQDQILNDLPNQPYNQMYNQIYKNTSCYSDFASTILQPIYISDCASIVQKSLVSGLNIFGTKFTEFVSDYATLNTLKAQIPSSTLKDDILQYSRGIYYATLFNNEIMKTWTIDITSNLADIVTFCSVLVIAASILILILYIVLNEVLILGRFRKEYEYFRTVYRMYFPEAIITKKKIIKFWLIKHGILKRK